MKADTCDCIIGFLIVAVLLGSVMVLAFRYFSAGFWDAVGAAFVYFMCSSVLAVFIGIWFKCKVVK